MSAIPSSFPNLRPLEARSAQSNNSPRESNVSKSSLSQKRLPQSSLSSLPNRDSRGMQEESRGLSGLPLTTHVDPEQVMQEVRNLESAAFDRIKQIHDSMNRRIDEITTRFDEAIGLSMTSAFDRMKQTTDSTNSRIEEIARRFDEVISVARAFESVQGVSEKIQLHVSALEAAVADLRSESATERERQDLKEENAARSFGELRQDLNTLQVMQNVTSVIADAQDSVKTSLQKEIEEVRREMSVQHAKQENALQSASGIGVNIQDLTSIVTSSQSSMKDFLNSEIAALRNEMAQERAQSNSHMEKISSLENSSTALVNRFNDDSQRAQSAAILEGSLEQLKRSLERNQGEIERLSSGLSEERTERCRALVELANITEDTRAQALNVLNENVTELKVALEVNQAEVQRLAQELGEERSERYKGLCDIARITEDVAKAAATTIDNAERRFAEVARLDPPDRKPVAVDDDSNLDITVDLNAKPTQPADEVRTCLEGALQDAWVNSMQKVELSSRVRVASQQLRSEILAEVSSRVASVEARVGGVEARVGAEADLAVRLGRLEAGQLDMRVKNLENDVRRHSIAITSFQEDRVQDKVKISSMQSAERALAAGQKLVIEPQLHLQQHSQGSSTRSAATGPETPLPACAADSPDVSSISLGAVRGQRGGTSSPLAPSRVSALFSTNMLGSSASSAGNSDQIDALEIASKLELTPSLQKHMEGLMQALQSQHKGAESRGDSAVTSTPDSSDPTRQEPALRLASLLDKLNGLMQATTHRIKTDDQQPGLASLPDASAVSEAASRRVEQHGSMVSSMQSVASSAHGIVKVDLPQSRRGLVPMQPREQGQKLGSVPIATRDAYGANAASKIQTTGAAIEMESIELSGASSAGPSQTAILGRAARTGGSPSPDRASSHTSSHLARSHPSGVESRFDSVRSPFTSSFRKPTPPPGNNSFTREEAAANVNKSMSSPKFVGRAPAPVSSVAEMPTRGSHPGAVLGGLVKSRSVQASRPGPATQSLAIGFRPS